MSLVTLKCGHCGGDIQLDDTREFGFCMYCGSKIMIQQEINNINITMGISEQVANLKNLMAMHFQAGNHFDALDAARKIIELHGADKDVWYVAGVSLIRSGTFEDIGRRRSELESYFSNHAVLAGVSSQLEVEVDKAFPGERKAKDDRLTLELAKSIMDSGHSTPAEVRETLTVMRSENPHITGLLRLLIIASVRDTSVPLSDVRVLLDEYRETESRGFDSEMEPLLEGMGVDGVLEMWDRIHGLSLAGTGCALKALWIAFSSSVDGWEPVVERAQKVLESSPHVQGPLDLITAYRDAFGEREPIMLFWDDDFDDVARRTGPGTKIANVTVMSKDRHRPSSMCPGKVDDIYAPYGGYTMFCFEFNGKERYEPFLYFGLRKREQPKPKSKGLFGRLFSSSEPEEPELPRMVIRLNDDGELSLDFESASKLFHLYRCDGL